jgi:flavin-binding protein dodecin
MTDQNQTYGLNQPTSPTSPHNALRFAIDTAKQAMMTCTIVKVMKIKDGNGAVGPIGRVDVQPLVQMVDGIQRTTDHTTVHNLPYMRMVGGASAVILDPKADDIGIVVTADRDISGVKQSGKMAPPGSNRRYNIADGMYVGSVVASKPTRYVRFDDSNGVQISPDGGTTSIWITPNRIDLGMKNAPHAVVTVDGPSTKVFAVISESGSKD